MSRRTAFPVRTARPMGGARLTSGLGSRQALNFKRLRQAAKGRRSRPRRDTTRRFVFRGGGLFSGSATCAGVAQWIEHQAANLVAVGSRPAIWATTATWYTLMTRTISCPKRTLYVPITHINVAVGQLAAHLAVTEKPSDTGGSTPLSYTRSLGRPYDGDASSTQSARL